MSFGLRISGVPKAEIAQRIEKVAAMLHFGAFCSSANRVSSGGSDNALRLVVL